MTRPSIADKRRTFHRLHESGCFVIPNPWDVGSARLLAGLGFQALATTSAGFAWTLGRADNQLSLACDTGLRVTVTCSRSSYNEGETSPGVPM